MQMMIRTEMNEIRLSDDDGGGDDNNDDDDDVL